MSREHYLVLDDGTEVCQLPYDFFGSVSKTNYEVFWAGNDLERVKEMMRVNVYCTCGYNSGREAYTAARIINLTTDEHVKVVRGLCPVSEAYRLEEEGNE
jgi:hypothetical protein